jgi:hypothetical protein
MRCPACRAENTEPTCRRCKADLSLLFTLEAQRDRARAEAADAVARGDGGEALRQARTAHRLRAGEDSLRLLAVGHLLRRAFGEALACYEQLKRA